VAEKPSNGTVVRIVLVVAAVSLLLYSLYLIRSILVLVVVALFLAIGFDPVVRALGRFRLKRAQAVLIVFLLMFLFVGGFIASMAPPLVRQTQRLAQQVPRFAENLSSRSDRFRDLDEQYDISKRLRESVRNLPSIVAGSAGRALGIAASVGRTIFSILTVLILTAYFLLDLPKLLDGAAKLLPKGKRKVTQERAQIVFDRISGYIIGNLVVSIIAGVCTFIVLSILGVPYALPLALWVAFADLIPMVGATLGAIPVVIVAFLDSVWVGIGAVIFYAIYQQIENYIVSPRVMRRAVDISAAAVILAALIGATLLGFVGTLLAIPVAASIKVLVQEIWLPQQEAA
jgi:predicted PurR-regulated permease PerM